MTSRGHYCAIGDDTAARLFVDGRIGPETFRLPDDATCQLAKNGNWSNSGNTVTGCALMVTVVVACGARRASTSHRLHDHHALDPKLVGSAAEALREECLFPIGIVTLPSAASALKTRSSDKIARQVYRCVSWLRKNAGVLPHLCVRPGSYRAACTKRLRRPESCHRSGGSGRIKRLHCR